ncbi:MAG TPA: LuxR C-terminal-related transcriptional regulator, partial [Roseiflexaceae bacterium]|nr:LuxR C-terminal-related transcriptional regulator [Roseiflexaceae bacterium]
ALARERNDLDRALELLEPALRAAEQAGVAVYLPEGYIALARTRQALGDSTAAQIALDRALHAARLLGSPAYARQIEAEQARLALAQGDLVAARYWQQGAALELAGQIDVAREAEALITARVQIAEGRQAPDGPALNAAHTLLAQLRQDAADQRRTGSLIEILVLVALADAAAGRRDQALETLRQALVLAMPEGYARIFLDEGALMRSLIADCRLQIAQRIGGKDSQRLQAYVERLLAAFSRTEGQVPRTEWGDSVDSVLSPQCSSLVESLSEREVEVLRLIASGASNQAIAGALVISIGTVKSHINHILGKLAASNRTEAVSRARKLGLLAV